MKMNFKTIIFFLIIYIQISIERRSSTRIQVVGVIGTILCKGKPYYHARVKLVNYLTFRYLDVLDSITTNRYGYFYVRGHTKGYFTIRPYLEIYHKCNRERKGYKEISIRIPTSYVFRGPVIHKYYNLGFFDLAGVKSKKKYVLEYIK
uniref:Transthyretin-like family protein n=1 Tax=Strongyloides venezuelensis TaxID=75913 RepID=A0A0K0FES7_STRVS